MSDWLTSAQADPFFVFLWLAIFVEVTLLSPQFLWLWIRSVVEAHHQRQARAFQETLGGVLLSVLEDDDGRARWIRDARAYPERVVRDFLVPYLLSTSGAYRDRLARLYRELGFLDLDLQALRSRFWYNRMRALRRLSLVVTAEHREVLLSLHHDHPAIRTLATQLVARVGTSADVLGMLRDWRITRLLHEHPIKLLVNTMPLGELSALMAHWEEFEDPGVRRILLVGAAARDPGSAAPSVRAASEDPHMEVRIGACIACGRLPVEESLPLLVRLLHAEEWQVRNQAAKSLGSLRSDVAIDPLASALADRQFWVRQNAARALSSLGEHGISRLSQVAAHDDDRYARDAAAAELTRFRLADSAGGTV